jgi:hypothetical protein
MQVIKSEEKNIVENIYQYQSKRSIMVEETIAKKTETIEQEGDSENAL